MALDAAHTNYADLPGQTVDKIFTATSLDALVETAFMINLCGQGRVGSSGNGNSKVAGWKEMDSLAGETVAEGGQASVVNYLQVAYTATATKAKCLVQITDEARGLGGLSLEEVKGAMRAGISREIDTKILDLASGLSASVGTTGTALELADIITGLRTLAEANAPDGQYFVCTPKTAAVFQAEVLAGAAPALAVDAQANLLAMRLNSSVNLKGSLFGILPIYTSNLVEFSSPDDLNVLGTAGRTFGFATSNLASSFWETPDGQVLKRDPEYGGTYHELSMYYAVTELQDATGVQAIGVS